MFKNLILSFPLKVFLLGVFISQPVFASNYSIIDITVESHQLMVRCELNPETNELTFNLPNRARLISINSPSNPQMLISNMGKNIYMDKIEKDGIRKVNIAYSIPLNHPDFSLKNWYPTLSDSNQQALIRMHSQEGYTGMVLPYQSLNSAGYTVTLNDNPILINAKLKRNTFSSSNFSYTLYYPFKWKSQNQAVENTFEAFSRLLGKLPQTNLIFIHLPNLSDTILTNQSQIVTFIPDTDNSSIKRSLSLLWLKNFWNLEPNLRFALSDVLKRIFDNSGNLQTNDSKIIISPRYDYYSHLLSSGFENGSLMQTDFNSMVKNFAMIHFAYYTLGLESFTNGLALFAQSSNHSLSDFKQSFLAVKTDENQYIIHYVTENLLPLSTFVPDVTLKENYLYRNNNKIPDIVVQINTNQTTTHWGSRRAIDLGHLNGFVFIDPGSQIPQLNFYNDKTETDPSLKKQRDAVYQAVILHHQLSGEKFRSIYNLEHFNAPENNPWNLPKDQDVFVAITKIMVPIRGRLHNASKEVILTQAKGDNKPKIIASRIRY